jgi:hypothetical protein
LVCVKGELTALGGVGIEECLKMEVDGVLALSGDELTKMGANQGRAGDANHVGESEVGLEDDAFFVQCEEPYRCVIIELAEPVVRRFEFVLGVSEFLVLGFEFYAVGFELIERLLKSGGRFYRGQSLGGRGLGLERAATGQVFGLWAFRGGGAHFWGFERTGFARMQRTS